MELDLNPNKYGKYQCPCCGYYTMREKVGNTYDICKVCFWEDDEVQLSNPQEAGGANRVSLIEGRENFKKFGCCEQEHIRHCKLPSKEELPD